MIINHILLVIEVHTKNNQLLWPLRSEFKIESKSKIMTLFTYINCGFFYKINIGYFYLSLNEDFVYIYGFDSSLDSAWSSEGLHIGLAPL